MLNLLKATSKYDRLGWMDRWREAGRGKDGRGKDEVQTDEEMEEKITERRMK